MARAPLVRPALAAAASSLLLAAGFAAPPAYAQLFSDNEARKAILDLRARVSEIEKRQDAQLAELAKRLDALEARVDAAQRGQLDLANQNESLRREIAALRGQVDTLTNELATTQRRNRDLYSDLDTRLKALEPLTVSVDGRNATVERAERAAYDAALGQFRAADYRGAVTGLQAFLARWPQSAYAASAQHFIGNAHYALKDHRAAIAAQQVVVDRHPESPRAAEALLAMAASHDELKERPRARALLERLVKDYPDSEAAAIGRERLAAFARAR